MIETIAELVEMSPVLVIGVVALLYLPFPMASVLDSILGQPRKKNRFDKKRKTKVQDLYRRLGLLSLLIVAVYAITQSSAV